EPLASFRFCKSRPPRPGRRTSKNLCVSEALRSPRKIFWSPTADTGGSGKLTLATLQPVAAPKEFYLGQPRDSETQRGRCERLCHSFRCKVLCTVDAMGSPQQLRGPVSTDPARRQSDSLTARGNTEPAHHCFLEG